MSEDEQPLLGVPQSETTIRQVEPQGRLSILHASLSFINVCGVLPIITLPRPVIDCGCFGIPLAVIVCGLQIYTAILLGRAWILAETIDSSMTSKSRYPYAALTEKAYGSKLGKVVSVLLNLNVFGGGIPTLIIVSQNLQVLFETVIRTGMGVDISYCYWLAVLGIVLCPLMWLGSPKDMKCLTVVSVCSVVCVATITCSYMIADPKTPTPSVSSHTNWEAVAITYGILSFQFGIHPLVLTIQMDMENKKDVGKSLFYSLTVMSLLFLATTFIAMFKYGSNTQNNVLQGLPKGWFLYCDILMVTLQMSLSMVVGGSAMFQDIEDRLDVPPEFGWKRCVIRSIIIVLAVLVGELLPRFDLIMGIVGGALSSPLVFFLPPLLYSRFRTLYAEYRETILRHPQSNITSGSTPPEEDLTNPRTLAGKSLVSDYRVEESCSASETSSQELTATNEERIIYKSILRVVTCGYMSLDERTSIGPLSYIESGVMGLIISLGVFATASSTYFSIRNAVLYAQYSVPACL